MSPWSKANDLAISPSILYASDAAFCAEINLIRASGVVAESPRPCNNTWMSLSEAGYKSFTWDTIACLLAEFNISLKVTLSSSINFLFNLPSEKYLFNLSPISVPAKTFSIGNKNDSKVPVGISLPSDINLKIYFYRFYIYLYKVYNF
jgi:hypothetical protein